MVFRAIRSVRLTGLCLTLAAAPVAAAQEPASTPPTLQQRLDHLGAQLDKQRGTLHVPGCAIAVVKDGQVVLARGFGLRDIERNLPVTQETLFAIGSSTKAFTATVIGMLIDEGKMSWDDSPRKFLPDFHLMDAKADEQLTIRDMLCHRSGLARTDLLWAGQVSRDEILQTIGKAELFTRFREKFNYNNVMYLAAGEASARAVGGGIDWDSLLAERILTPLNMVNSTTSYDAAQENPMLAKGYIWDKDKSQYKHQPMRKLENIAPAGAINSTATDMAQWVRFLLGKGEIDGKRLVSAERIDETWTTQIEVAGESIGYGLGWMIHQWQDKRLIEHGGNIDGFAAQVALLPDENVGFALLTNVTATPLQAMSIDLVFSALLSESLEAEGGVDLAAVQPYLGKYHFDALKSDVTVLVQAGKLAVDVPGQMVFELKPPDDAGKWFFALTDTIAVSFVRNAAGEITGMKIYQAGMEFELPREGVAQPVEIGIDEARKYVGTYHLEQPQAMDVKVLVKNGRLAVDVPNQMVYDLHLPDEEGKWVFRATDKIAVKFNADESGAIVSMSMFQEGEELLLPRLEAAAATDVPTVDEVVALQKKGYGSAKLADVKSLQMRGTVHFVHQGVIGDINILAADLGHYIQHMDMGKFGFIKLALNGEQAWTDSTFTGFEELHGEFLRQTRLQNPLVLFADWGQRDFFDRIEIAGVESLGEKKVYLVELASGEDIRCAVYLDAETGLAAKEVMALSIKGVGPIETTITYEDYRDVEGLRVPFRFTVSNEFNGSMRGELTDVALNVDLPPNPFAPPPTSAPGRRNG